MLPSCQRAKEFVAEQQSQAVIDAVPGGIVPKPKRQSQISLLDQLVCVKCGTVGCSSTSRVNYRTSIEVRWVEAAVSSDV